MLNGKLAMYHLNDRPEISGLCIFGGIRSYLNLYLSDLHQTLKFFLRRRDTMCEYRCTMNLVRYHTNNCCEIKAKQSKSISPNSCFSRHECQMAIFLQ